MGCICKCHDKCIQKCKKKKSNENQIFEDMKKKLKYSLNNVYKTLNGINDWDTLFNPEEETGLKEEEFKLNKININDQKYNNISLFLAFELL